MIIQIGLGFLALGVVILFVILIKLKRGIEQLRFDLVSACKKQEDQARENSSKVKSLVAIALGQSRSQEAVEPLVTAMQNEDPELARMAAAALVPLGKAAIGPVSDAAGRNKVSVPLAMTVIRPCVETEDDLLEAVRTGGQSVEFSIAVLDHEAVGEEVLNWVASEGPIGVLSYLVAMERAEGSQAQATAQKRLQEEAQRRQKEEGEEQRRRYEDMHDDEEGPCYCRWQ